MNDENQPINESNSLETQDSPLEMPYSATQMKTPENPESPKPIKPPKQKINIGSWMKLIKERVNIYLALLVIVLLLLGGFTYFAISRNKDNDKLSDFTNQNLTEEDLENLAGSDTSVGDPKQTLTVESNAIFTGGVLVRGNLDVAGTIKVGGAISLPGLNVGGSTNLDQVAVKTLTVANDASVQGKLTIQNSLSVTGSASFSGPISAPQITIDNLQINKDLQLNRHIDAGGGTLGRTNGGALGGGGSASVSGTDTAGSVTINTGGGAPSGCFVTVTFAAVFNATPHVVISPTTSVAATLDYYATRTTTGFSICTASDPPDNTSGIGFDFIVID